MKNKIFVKSRNVLIFIPALVLLIYGMLLYLSAMLYERGREDFEAKRFDSVIREMRISLWLQSDSASGHNLLGEALLSKGQISEAILEFHKAIRLNTDLTTSYYYLGEAFIKQGKKQDALEAWRNVLNIIDDSSWHKEAQEAINKYS